MTSPTIIPGEPIRDGLSVLMGGDRLGEVGVQPPVLRPAGFADREEPLDGAVPCSVLVPQLVRRHITACRSARSVVLLVAGTPKDSGERPERLIALQKPGGEPGGLRVAATSASLQRLELLARSRKVGLQGGQIRGVTPRLLRVLKTPVRHRWSFLPSRPGAPSRSPSAMKSRRT